MKYHKGQLQTGSPSRQSSAVGLRCLRPTITTALPPAVVSRGFDRSIALGERWAVVASQLCQSIPGRCEHPCPDTSTTYFELATDGSSNGQNEVYRSYFEADEEDEDFEEMVEKIRGMTRQRNHKTQNVNRAHPNQTGATFGDVWDGVIRMDLRASAFVARILGR